MYRPDELRKLAAEKMAQEKPGQTVQATALVHEASKWEIQVYTWTDDITTGKFQPWAESVAQPGPNAKEL